jgi:hypothetical protein
MHHDQLSHRRGTYVSRDSRLTCLNPVARCARRVYTKELFEERQIRLHPMCRAQIRQNSIDIQIFQPDNVTAN